MTDRTQEQARLDAARDVAIEAWTKQCCRAWPATKPPTPETATPETTMLVASTLSMLKRDEP